MKDFQGSNIANVKTHNMQAILLSLLHSFNPDDEEQAISRIQLSQRTRLSSTTITNLIAELIEQRIVAEDKNPRELENRSVGRPRTGLRLVPDARYVIGVHIGVGLYCVAMLKLMADLGAR